MHADLQILIYHIHMNGTWEEMAMTFDPHSLKMRLFYPSVRVGTAAKSEENPSERL